VSSALLELAHAAGLLVEWVDVASQPRTVGTSTVRALLATQGWAAADERQCRDSLQALRAEADATPPLLTAQVGEAVPWRGTPDAVGRWRHEDGESRQARFDAQGVVQAPPRPGYWRLETGTVSQAIAVAPLRAWSVAEALGQEDPRAWGLALQVYSARGEEDAGIGDAAGAAAWLRTAAQAGADALALSPVHATGPIHRGYSPYSPSDRRYFDPLHAAPARSLGAFAHATLAADPALRARFEALQREPLIDWPAAAQTKWRWLRSLHDRLETAEAGAHADYRRFRQDGGASLRQYAAFAAAAHGDEDPSLHEFAQWLAARSWEGLQRDACERGMRIGLVADLAVGFDPRGAEAAAWPGAVLPGVVLGAPPDAFNPDGQVWGIGGYSPRGLRAQGYAPFITLLRAVMHARGGIRIDHILGLLRLWLVPEGAGSGEGGYLRYPLQDLLNLLVLESWRHRAIVIGEDLGVVPRGLRGTLAARGILGIDVLLFSRDNQGQFLPPAQWRRDAVATTTTHDLPTLCGWRQSLDLQWRQRLGLGSAEQLAHDRGERLQSLQQLQAACASQGLDSGDGWFDALRYAARANACLALLPVEDALALREQPNLPGTVDTHPNWRQRLPQPLPASTLSRALAGFADARAAAATAATTA
jgi:4-alpha-glucanotransferase